MSRLPDIDRVLRANEPLVVRLDPRAQKHLSRAVELYGADRAQDAVGEIDAVLTAGPEDALLLLVRAAALVKLDKLREAHQDVDLALELKPGLKEAKTFRREVLDMFIWRTVEAGYAHWDGSKPKGSNPPIEITPGPPISDYVIEDRR